MAVGKEIRTKIASIKNTQKITRAMEMVAASKMRKTQDRMRATRPYAEKIAKIIKHLAHAHPEYKHPFLVEKKQCKRIGLIVISSDRGLCGGLNSNLFRKTVAQMQQWNSEQIEIDICTIGQKGAGYFRNISANIIGQSEKLGDTPHLADIVGIIKIMLDGYEQGTIDEIHVVHNQFVNTMKQDPQIKQLVPVKAEEIQEELKGSWDYIYEPDAVDVLDALMVRYIESIVLQGLIENNACEQAARMVAMKSASDNAGTLIDELQLVYNKARQAAITQEISEIVAGAAAI
jgi:F-type H+-transporting ATPase subunit gamma